MHIRQKYVNIIPVNGIENVLVYHICENIQKHIPLRAGKFVFGEEEKEKGEMEMMGWLVLLAILMWVSQTVLGLWQFKRFNRRLKEMRSEGRVAIGKAKGKFMAGAIALLCIDQDCKILRAEVMEGRTVFAGFRSVEQLNGCNLLELSEAQCKGLGRQVTAAVLGARKDYEEYRKLQAEREAEEDAEASRSIGGNAIASQ